MVPCDAAFAVQGSQAALPSQRLRGAPWSNSLREGSILQGGRAHGSSLLGSRTLPVVAVAAALGGALLLARPARRRRWRVSKARIGASRLRAAKGKSLLEADDDFRDDGDLWSDLRGPPPGQINTFAAGATLKTAQLFAQTRTFAVAAWDEDVTPKPIFAVSNGSGEVSRDLAETAFQQFGPSNKAMIKVVAEVETVEDVRRVVAIAASMAPEDALAIEKAGAMIVFTLASQELGALLVAEGDKQGVPCINAMEGVMTAMEKCFKMWRAHEATDEGEPADSVPKTVFAASDCSGAIAYGMVSKALKQFPRSNVDAVTVCPMIRSLQEIDRIVDEAKRLDGLIVYTFASPGMSRFMRQQCERAMVLYAEVLQPVVVAFERYLDYPPVGVPGGHYIATDEPAPSLDSLWEMRPPK